MLDPCAECYAEAAWRKSVIAQSALTGTALGKADEEGWGIAGTAARVRRLTRTLQISTRITRHSLIGPHAQWYSVVRRTSAEDCSCNVAGRHLNVVGLRRGWSAGRGPYRVVVSGRRPAHVTGNPTVETRRLCRLGEGRGQPQSTRHGHHVHPLFWASKEIHPLNRSIARLQPLLAQPIGATMSRHIAGASPAFG
jgi:hypothetical protein